MSGQIALEHGSIAEDLAKEDKNDLLENGPFPVIIRCHHCNISSTRLT
ncbi:MAG: hypothetical protein KKB30_08485 [Proteobacteria bacterium]|nr:hypothetical protein [Pseudomonadota bacterium]MBU1714709.1 hypothetical protein [Pseudomonadota bacterium]